MNKNPEQIFNEVINICNSKGGKCLSENYHNSKEKLTFKCKNDHKWETTAILIRKGYWCLECKKIKKLEEIKSIAINQEGQCTSTKYTKSTEKLNFQCKQGHKWSATPATIKTGSWCPKCINSKSRFTLDYAKVLASLFNGTVTATKNVTSTTQVTWECSAGHKWESISALIERGTWCPDCKKISKLKNLEKVAIERNGRLLTKEYLGSTTKHTWICDRGHIWKATPNSILDKNSWCKSIGKIRRHFS